MEHAAELALASLASELGVAPAELRRAVEAIHWHDWTHDPLAGGAYAYVLVGGAGVRSRLARPVEDTLYFAGEACAEQGRDGTVDGALASGRQAARFILASES
jgi:monoamine oxidase